jgi:hypothetical protein
MRGAFGGAVVACSALGSRPPHRASVALYARTPTLSAASRQRM